MLPKKEVTHMKIVELIEKAKIKFNNKYKYEITKNIKVTDKILIECPEHGAYTQEARVHLKSIHGCRMCANINSATLQRKTKEQFITQATELHKGKYIYDKVHYINDTTKVTITCKIHGDFTQQAGSHLQGNGCKSCGIILGREKQKHSKEALNNIKLPQNISINFADYSNFKGKLTGFCDTHGEFTTTLAIIKRANRICPDCADLYRGWNRSLYKNIPTTLYVLDLGNNLFKFGITKENDISLRYSKTNYSKIKNINFQVTVLEGSIAYDLEKVISKQFKNYKYTGEKIFTCTGNTEIITIDPTTFIKELIHENFRLL